MTDTAQPGSEETAHPTGPPAQPYSVKEANRLRAHIGALVEDVDVFIQGLKDSDTLPGEDRQEMFANLMLAKRHLEDARMRCGKMLQAQAGGVSKFDTKEEKPEETAGGGEPAE